jgi:hypothetical protein
MFGVHECETVRSFVIVTQKTNTWLIAYFDVTKVRLLFFIKKYTYLCLSKRKNHQNCVND